MKFHGNERQVTLSHLVNEWLPKGPPVAILQGFPGCGKTQIAAEVASMAPRRLQPIVVQADSTDPVLDLYIELESGLSAVRIDALSEEFDKGTHAKLDRALLGILRSEQILVVIDEFQRLFPRNATAPPQPWQKLIEDLDNSPSPKGRLLLISNRAIKTARWCESAFVEEVHSLPDAEAMELLSELLQSQGVSSKVPEGKHLEIVHRLGGNPRALRTLATSLRSEILNDLMSAAPDLSTTGDVALHAQLVEEFEKELMERALPKLEADLLKFMRWLSVHRRPFHKEAMAQFTGGQVHPDQLRKQLFDRFLVWQTDGGDTPHPLAREISVSRLRAESAQWKQAHSLAANYYFRPFKAKQISGASNIPASYTELRHHLFESDRIDELHEADERLTKYALSQISLVTPVPVTREALEERIVILLTIPEDRAPKVLHNHLARCLVRRGKDGDKSLALHHIREATSWHPDSSPWLLRLDLEFELYGIDYVIPVINEGLMKIGGDGDVAPIYKRGAELLTKADLSGDAVKLLERGMAAVPPEKASALYQPCAELLAKQGRIEEAIKLLEKGLAVPEIAKQSMLYQPCAELLAKRGRIEEAIKLLEKGLAVPGMSNQVTLYQPCAELLAKQGRIEEAIKLLEKGLAVPEIAKQSMLYQSCAELLARQDRIEEAIKLLEKGLAVPGMSSQVTLYQPCAELLAKQGRIEEAIKLLEKGLAVPEIAKQSILYQPCAELLAKQGRIEEAIKLLEKGLAVPGMSSQVTLYQPYAELLAKQGRIEEAIKLLEKGLAVPEIAKQSILYQPCAELLAKQGRIEEAINLLEKGLAVVPSDQRFILFQTEIQLVGNTGDCAKTGRIVERGLAAVSQASGRHKIAETGLRVVSSCGGVDGIKTLLSLGSPSQLDDPQRALADYMLARITGDWQRAVDMAQKGREAFPRYGALRFSEADARIALGQTAEAYELMKSYEAGLRQGRDNPVVWLKAFVSLVAGHPKEAESLAAMFAPSAYNPAVSFDQSELLRLWAAAQSSAMGPLTNNFPGAAEYFRNNIKPVSSVAAPENAPASRQPSVLAVATEWLSAHGGVSTFNRELCRAFANEGYKVWCYVSDATPEEITHAEDCEGVTILRAPHEAHSTQDARLRNRPGLPTGTEPDLIISHDRITGPAGASLAENHFRRSKHVTFIHTASKQIEWFKEQGVDTTATGTAELRRQLQINLARKACLVAAVGPKLQNAMANELHALTPPKTAVEFLPGLETPFRFAAPPPANECLVLGRAEDAHLKGLDIAARAMAKLLATHQQTITPSPVLVIRGAPIGTGDALREDLMRKTQLGANHLHIREYSSDVDVIRRDMLSSALVLMPSRTEGFGLAALEAIALGIPVLVSDQSGLAETLRSLAPNHLKRCIVHVTADLETDAVAWERELDFVLSDKSAAFARANELRNALAPHLSWQKAIRGLIESISLKAV